MTDTLKYLRRRAEAIGVKILAVRDDVGWGYWLTDADTGDGVWEDENFSTSHSELEGKIEQLERERAQ